MSEILLEKQERMLNEILNLIIPPSEDGKMPGAADVGFLDYIQSENNVKSIQEGLIKINEVSQNKFGLELTALCSSMKTELIKSVNRELPHFFKHLTTLVIQCYYQHDDVLAEIGLEQRPPFPEGYQIVEGDLILLEPVYLRGKIYRE